MSKGVVFQQWYKSINEKDAGISNRKHLVYIATRLGAIYNPGCGFGLWGRLPGMVEAINLEDFELAKKAMSAASREHTVYRTIFSVDDETAKTHGFYDRAKRQDVITRKIDVVAKEMSIDRKDFCWTASMHCSKGHPHVHVMYWDNSSKVRQEFIPKDIFEIKAERIRAEFGREIYREELAECRAEQDELLKRARLELQALCKEANLAEALNLKHVSPLRLDKLEQQFAALAISVPDRGSFKYSSLPAGYKVKVDAFLNEVLKISDFAKLLERYLKTTDQISALYGNGDEKVQYNRKKAMKKLYIQFGNCTMSAIREYVSSLSEELNGDLNAEAQEILPIIKQSVQRILPLVPGYQELLKLMPRERTPMHVLEATEPFKAQKDALVKELCRDIRIKTLLRTYVKAHVENASKPTIEEDKKQPESDKKQFETEARRHVYRAVARLVQQQLQEDAGYRMQDATSRVMTLLLRMFSQGSQSANQARSQRDLLRHQSTKELSQTARLNRKKQREQEGGWVQE